MTIKNPVLKLIEQLNNTETNKVKMTKILDILQKKYKMTPFEILALFKNPPTLEYRMDNKHLLLEDL